jgi:hypothetical protein
MTEGVETGGVARARSNRLVWGGAALLFLAPLAAMQFTKEVVWGPLDFAVFGTMLLVACGAYELVSRRAVGLWHRAAMGLAIATAFLLVWANLAVGFIGDESDPANLMYGGVLALGVIGAVVTRLRARGMAVVLVAMALAQALAALVAQLAGWDQVWAPTAVFVALWLASACLSLRAARTTRPGAG